VTEFEIVRVAAGDVDDVLPLLRGYCEFYEVAQSDVALRALCDTLLAHPETAGIQLLARDAQGAAVGFATVYWTYSTLSAGPIGLMNDLYVAPLARGGGVGRALIDACAAECADRGVGELEWFTAPGNKRAQAVYDRTLATREDWVSYSLPVS
jgi:GNAT superfamily N-acetyltransferase